MNQMVIFPPLMPNGMFMTYPVAAIMEMGMTMNSLFGAEDLFNPRELPELADLVKTGGYTIQPYGAFEAESLTELRVAVIHRLHAAYDHHLRGRWDFAQLSHMVDVLTTVLRFGENRDWTMPEPMTVTLRPF